MDNFWTVMGILKWAADYFRAKGVSEPRASAEVLLAHALNLSRLDLYLRHDQPLTPEELARFKALVIRRRQGEPPAYITGRKEFWSLDFKVTPAVLIPRPETEVLVEALIEMMKKELGGGGQGQTAPAPSPGPPLDSTPQLGWGLEVGTGSGAVVIALARELPGMRWLGIDISDGALTVARDNARRHGVAERIHFIRGDLMSGIKAEPRFHLVAANLPYIPRPVWEQLPADIKDFEPREALLGGDDGLALLRPLISQAHRVLASGGRLALEVADGMAPKVVEMLQETKAYQSVEILKDYQGADRVVLARRMG